MKLPAVLFDEKARLALLPPVSMVRCCVSVTGALVVVTVKGTPLLTVPPTVTVTGPVVAPSGTGITMLAAAQLVGVAAVPLKRMMLAALRRAEIRAGDCYCRADRPARGRQARDCWRLRHIGDGPRKRLAVRQLCRLTPSRSRYSLPALE